MAPTSRFPDWKIATDCMRWTDDGSLRQESPRPAGPEIFCNKWRHKFLRRRPRRCSSLKEKFGKLTFGKRCTASVHFRSRAIGGSRSNTAIGISAFCPEGKRCVKFRRVDPTHSKRSIACIASLHALRATQLRQQSTHRRRGALPPVARRSGRGRGEARRGGR